MNKTININLAGFVFSVDEDAFHRLKGYLESIKRYLNSLDGKEEIIRDVEARLVEIFQSRMKDEREVVLIADVEHAISILGQPEDYRMDDDNSFDNFESQSTFKPKKRIFRNPDDKVIGGVCGGLGAYFGIDPVWLRILLVVLFFTPMNGLLVYIVLWIVMPEAKTTADKLQMKGEEVNLSSIQKSVREEMNKAGKAMDDSLGSEKFGERSASKMRRAAEDTSNFFLSLFKMIFNALFRILGFIGVTIGILVLIVLFSTLFWGNFALWGDNFSTWEGVEFLSILFPNSSMHLGMLWGIGLFFIPLTLLALMAIVRALFKLPKLHPLVYRVSLFLSFIGLILVVNGGIRIANQFKSDGFRETTVQLEDQSKQRFIKVLPIPGKEELDIDFNMNGKDFRWHKESNATHFNLVEFTIESTDAENAYLIIKKQARGRSKTEARYNAQNAVYVPLEEDSILIIPAYYSLINRNAWRGQEVNVILKLPIGQAIYLDESLDGTIYDIKNITNTIDYRMLAHNWIMTQNGLSCMDCPDSKSNDPWKELQSIPERK